MIDVEGLWTRYLWRLVEDVIRQDFERQYNRQRVRKQRRLKRGA